MALAAEQHGVVSRAQLRAAGVGESAIERRVTARRMRPLHRGVYRVGPIESPQTHAMAAVLAGGRNAVVSHGSAAALWQLLPERSSHGPMVHVSLRKGDRRIPGICVHRTHALRRVDVTTLHRIPITTPARTLLDIAAIVRRNELSHALSEALARRLATRAQIAAVLKRNPRRPGAGLLRELLTPGRPTLTRSEAERRFLRMIEGSTLPLPEANVRVEGFEVDFFWRSARLVTEIDGFATHALSHGFEADRRRDAALAAVAVRVIRVTWRQLVQEPHAVIVRLTRALDREPA